MPGSPLQCLDFFFGSAAETEYCCPCIIFYASRYNLPALATVCRWVGGPWAVGGRRAVTLAGVGVVVPARSMLFLCYFFCCRLIRSRR